MTLAELAVTGKVELTWNTYRGGIGDVVDSIRGPTKGALGLTLDRNHMYYVRLTRYHSQPDETCTVSMG